MTIRLDELGIGEEWPEGLTIVYDGDCPVCRAYSQYARLRSTFDTVSLVNVREQPRLAAILYAHGIDLDDRVGQPFLKVRSIWVLKRSRL